MNIKKILIIGVIVSSFAACSTNTAPIVVPTMEEIVNVNVTSYYNSLWFDHNSIRVSEDFSAILKLNADYLKADPMSLVQLQGNASEIGSKQYNYKLGLDRAHAVAKELAKLGVNPKQIQEVSFGSSNAFISKDKYSPQSRRVDIVYTSGAPISYFIEQLPIVSTEDETVNFDPISVKEQTQVSHINISSPSAVPPLPNKQEELNASSPVSNTIIVESNEAEAESIMDVPASN